MSIDLNWETLTTGPDGQELAHRIRDFIHTKFQTVPLPRFIQSVTVHDFEFGAIPPQVELKDITDPLPDFYEENTEADDEDSEDDDAESTGGEDSEVAKAADRRRAAAAKAPDSAHHHHPHHHHLPPHIDTRGLRPPDLASPFLGVSPGISGASSNLSYFHSHLHAATGLSGTQTPLARPWGGGASTPPPGPGPGHGHARKESQSSVLSLGETTPLTPTLPPGGQLREKHSVSTLAPTSAGTSRPPTRGGEAGGLVGSAIEEEFDDGCGDGLSEGGGLGGGAAGEGAEERRGRRFREPRVEDMQAVFRIRYAGDVRLLLTADILLDYPMPSFVGIPVRLSITGLTFDGVGVLANIRKRVHFCFLSPEDALAAVGEDEEEDGPAGQGGGRGGSVGGLLQEIRVESEIGQREGGKQSLKNVSKVERFVLEQVRRIFEEEFVYPSFWTFLV